ncbi:MAG: LamG-like jellyroll fold domain-containing protein, partial [Phycisphaerae bacterium]
MTSAEKKGAPVFEGLEARLLLDASVGLTDAFGAVGTPPKEVLGIEPAPLPEDTEAGVTAAAATEGDEKAAPASAEEATMTAEAEAVGPVVVSADGSAREDAAKAEYEANQPIGQAKGIYPGRVAWVRDPAATSWNGSTGHWWDDANTDAAVVAEMLSTSIRWLTGQGGDAAAWDALFRYFNQTRSGRDVGYTPGEKVAIKINLNNSNSQGDSDNQADASPQLIRELLRQLIQQVGVSASDITIYDASRSIPDRIYNPCSSEFPGVRFVDNSGGGGRIAAVADTSARVYYGNAPASQDSYLPTCVTQAAYHINVANLKGHVYAGVTLCAKNLFGSIRQLGGSWSPSQLHSYIDHRPGGSPPPMGSYNPLVDLIGHEHLGGKTLLWLIDGLYGAYQQGSTPTRWSTFGNDWPSSLFVSQDPVAIDSVGFDLVRAEWSVYDYSDNYLHESATAEQARPWGSYDPEADGSGLDSLGTHEHWDGPTTRQYTRNLGTGDGIELVSSDPGVDRPTADIIDVVPDPRNSPVADIDIVFSEAVTGLDLSDLSLTRDGGGNLLTGEPLETTDGITWTLGGLSALTAPSGTYTLTLTAAESGIQNAAGDPLEGDAVDTWATDSDAPTADIIDIAPDPRNSAVDAVDIVFTEPVTGLDITDLSLTLNGGANLLSTEPLTTTDNVTWTLGGLGSVTGAGGAYSLTLTAAGSGIQDSVGNVLAADASDTWSTDVQPPTADYWYSAAEHAAAVGEVRLEIPDDGTFSEPRTAGVSRLVIEFSEAIDPTSFTAASVLMAGTDAADAPVDLSGIAVATSTVSGDTVGVIDLAPALPDAVRYIVQIEGVTDVLGNPLSGDDNRVFTALAGDAGGDLRVNAIDLSYIWPRRTNPIDGVSADQARSDVNCDGCVNAVDLSAAWPRRGPNLRNVLDPVLRPAEPRELAATAVTSTRIDLTWTPPTGAGGCIDHYVIFRDGARADTSPTTSYSDTGLDETRAYTYEVSAVSFAGFEGGKSAPVEASPRPSLQQVYTTDDTHVIVTFGKAVEEGSAETVGNYTITYGQPSQTVTISTAMRGTDTTRVVLVLSTPLVDGVIYTLRVENVEDAWGNPVEDGSEVAFELRHIDPSLLGWWTFDEGSGGTAEDFSGNQHHMTLNGATWTASGRIGGALRFDGNDTAVDDDGRSYIDGLTSFTVAMWIKADNANTENGIFTVGQPGSSNCLSLRHATWGVGGYEPRPFKAFLSTTGGNTSIEGRANSQTTEWQHVALTWDANEPDGASMLLYVDGVEQLLSWDYGLVAGSVDQATQMLIGMGQRGTNYGWVGLVDDVRIYGRQLEAYEIEALVAAAPPAQATGESAAMSGGISPALGGAIGLADSGGADPSPPPGATPRTPGIDALLWG